MARLKVGDKVKWKGAWGTEPSKEVIVEGIEVCKSGSKYGRQVNSADWDVVRSGRKVVVDLNNGHWAYGDQLQPIK